MWDPSPSETIWSWASAGRELAESLEELVGEEFIKPFERIAKAYSKMVKAMGHATASGVDLRAMLSEKGELDRRPAFLPGYVGLYGQGPDPRS